MLTLRKKEGVDMELDEFIKEKKKLYEKQKYNQINEAQTKEWFIKPFFECLGWDFSTPEDVVPEDDDTGGKRPDYGFYIDGKIKFFVEAKPLNFNIDDPKIISEKVNYCNNANVPFLIITNGKDYRIYYIGIKGANTDKLLIEFSVFDEIEDEIIEKIRKSAFKNNLLEQYAKNISIYSTVKNAFEKIIQSCSKKLCGMINDEIKKDLGHKFGDEDIVLALKHFTLEISEEDIEEKDKVSNKNASNNQSWEEKDQFKSGKWSYSMQLYEKIKNEMEKEGITYKISPTELYIGFINEGKNFMQIHGQKKGLKAWLTIDLGDLSEAEKIKVRDVSKIGHWGMGNTECVIRSENDIEWFMMLVKKTYEKSK
jgi:predicted transport protein